MFLWPPGCGSFLGRSLPTRSEVPIPRRFVEGSGCEPSAAVLLQELLKVLLGIVKDSFSVLDLRDAASDFAIPLRTQLDRIEAPTQSSDQFLTILGRQRECLLQ